ncbi:IS5 family transposase [Streptomyces sp. OM5714]|uniref:IS5 family transposase n=1 Tax=Streptomyces sp. OM5714 TaxID=2602736 RepID=UPI0019DBEB29|nr:IS5 family transposase [Streptomyces sp. OM5714]KAF2775087.1 IS4 family transposase [Streptomyces sp. OM5714]KAF2775092.1 IS4 family transposase [Streptomyces sp. OM5714]
MSDARWALIEPVFTDWRAKRTGPGTAARFHELREIVNAILYVNRTGVPWEYLPHDFPPYKTVYDYYAKWETDGTTQQVQDLLRDRTRQSHGRSVQPTAAVVDAQSVKTSANVAETSQGIDVGKKIKGRKRHVITDTLGLVLAVLVTAANVYEAPARRPGRSASRRDQGLGRRRIPNSVFNHGARLGIDVEVVQRPRTKGFEPLPKRRVIERTFGWLTQHRRLARDYEALPERSRAMIHWAMATKWPANWRVVPPLCGSG